TATGRTSFRLELPACCGGSSGPRCKRAVNDAGPQCKSAVKGQNFRARPPFQYSKPPDRGFDMRRLVLSTAAALALVVPGATQSAAGITTKAVKITATGFSPTSVYIATGNAVKWTNKDTKNHQVVANNGAFASPIIAPSH